MLAADKFFPYQAIVDRPKVTWPGDARIAVWVVPNIEHFHLQSTSTGLDVRTYSRQDYGNRVGVWRVMEVLKKHGIPGTVALNGEAAEHYPRILDAVLDLDWELMGHGLTNSIRLTDLTAEAEATTIKRTREIIENSGQRMRGWLGPSLAESPRTLDLLRAEGVDYVCDWVNDDLPYEMRNGLYSIPYSIELNDMPLFNNPVVSAQEFGQRIKDAFDVLYAEGQSNGRVLGIALHPFLTGSPHRIKYVDEALGYVASHDQVWFATGSEIIDAYGRGI